MRRSRWIKWAGAFAIAAMLGGVAAPRADGAFILEVKAISVDLGQVSNDGKTVLASSGNPSFGNPPDQITLGIYITHTLDAAPATDPLRFGLGLFFISVNSPNDRVNGVLTPGAVGNITQSTLHGGPNDPANPSNGGSGFALPASFNALPITGGDGEHGDVDFPFTVDPDTDLINLGAAQDITKSPLRYAPFYGASQTVGVPVTTLLGTFTFTVSNNLPSSSTQINIYLPNTTGVFDASAIRALTGSSTDLGGGGVGLGPLLLTSANIGTPVTVLINTPEPGSVGMLGAGALVMFRRRRR